MKRKERRGGERRKRNEEKGDGGKEGEMTSDSPYDDLQQQ